MTKKQEAIVATGATSVVSTTAGIALICLGGVPGMIIGGVLIGAGVSGTIGMAQ